MMNSGLVQVLQFPTSNKLSWEEEEDGVTAPQFKNWYPSTGQTELKLENLILMAVPLFNKVCVEQ